MKGRTKTSMSARTAHCLRKMREVKVMGIDNLIGFDKALNSTWKAGIYCRLSKDDELKGESASIANQREILTNYCISQGFQIVAQFQDDGRSGLSMDRPGLQSLLQAIEEKKINLVITRDASRLGRNYLETGQLMEEYFPKKGVRYIALNDGIDTAFELNEIAPFKNILNEFFSHDLSRKVHSSYLLRAKQGRYTGCVPPFGYLKDPDQKGHLIIDEETAWIVRKIFDYALENKGSGAIVRRLDKEKIPCPAWWLRKRGIRNHVTKWEKLDPENGKYVWDFGVVERILENPIYYGAVCSQKFESRFKVGIVRKKTREEWVIVEGMHEPIIDRNTFDLVQGKIKKRQHPRKDKGYSLFAGLLKCGECGKALTIRYTHEKHPKDVYCCKTYTKFGARHCTQHRVAYDVLYQLVLERIRNLAKAALSDDEAVLDQVAKIAGERDKDQAEDKSHPIARLEDRLKALERLVTKLYEDYIAERVSPDNFDSVLQSTQKEQEEVRRQLDALKAEAASGQEQGMSLQEWKELIRGYADIKELDRETLNRLVRSIIVHETVDGKKRHLKIEIHFNFRKVTEVAEAADFGDPKKFPAALCDRETQEQVQLV